MGKPVNIQDLNDGRFSSEPIRRRRIENPDFDPSKKSTPSNPKFLFVMTRAWSVSSRYLLIHLLTNVLGQKLKGTKGKLPSIDEEALSKCTHPIAKLIVEYRSKLKTAQSISSALKYVFPNESFIGEPSHTGFKVQMEWQAQGYDCVERIFATSDSLPLNTDKRVRNCLVCPPPTLEEKDIPAQSLLLLKQIEK